jgi:hypothetical protein
MKKMRFLSLTMAFVMLFGMISGGQAVSADSGAPTISCTDYYIGEEDGENIVVTLENDTFCGIPSISLVSDVSTNYIGGYGSRRISDTQYEFYDISKRVGGVTKDLEVGDQISIQILKEYLTSGTADTNTVIVNVQEARALAVNTAAPKIARLNGYYEHKFTAIGGYGVRTYACTGGTLPNGLSLADDGTLSGNVEALGTYNFDITATDSGKTPETSTGSFTISVIEPPQYGDYKFMDNTIWGYTGVGGDITIPSEINGEAVTALAQYLFENRTDITSVIIPSGVTEIGGCSFDGCTGLTRVSMPDSVTFFGNYTFGGCTSLTKVTIPNGVTSLVSGAFLGCTGLTGITIPSGVTFIQEDTFEGCTNLKSALFMGSSAPEVQANAFSDCSDDFTIYYLNGSTGYASTLSGYTTVELQPSVAALVADINAVPGLTAAISGSTVTVMGTATLTSTSDAALTLDIPAGVTVVWAASLSGGGSKYLLEPTGDGIFEVADGANIVNTACQATIYCCDGKGNLNVTGGKVSTTGSGMAIGIAGDWLMTMSGGEVSANEASSCAIFGKNSVVITGGTVSATGTDGYQLYMGKTTVYRIGVLDPGKIMYHTSGVFAEVGIDAAVTQAVSGTSIGLTVTGHNLSTGDSVTAVWAKQNGVSGINISYYSDMEPTTAYGTEFLAVPGVTVTDTGSPTDSNPPTVTSVIPNGTGVAINGNIAITFSEPMNTVSGAVYLSSDGGGSYGSALTGGSWSGSDLVYTIPYSGLSYNTTYTIRLETFKDTAGNVMDTDTSHSFTTKTVPSATSYTVNIEVVTGGSITVNKTTATAAEIINLTIIPDSGKRLKAGTLKYNDGTDHAITGTSFTMPSADVTVSAEFEEIPSTVTNAEKVAADKAILDIYYATGDDASSVTQDLSLTVTGAVYGSTITWVSDNTDIISNTGTVTRPAYASGDANVAVTASIYNNGVRDSKSFSLKVLKCAVPTFTVTFDPAGGTRIGGGELIQTVAQGSAATAPAVARSGYTFTGWDKTFSNITGNMTVTASWTYDSGSGSGGSSGSEGSSGGGSSSGDPTPTMQPEKKPDQPVSAGITVTAKADKAGLSTVAVSEQTLTSAIAKAQTEAKASGNTDNGIGVALNVTMPKGSDSLNLTLTSNSLQSLIAANVQNLEINGTPVSLGLDLKAIQEIQRQSTGSVTVSITPVTGLKEDAKTLIGTRPIYNISISYVKDGKTVNITSLGNGSATLSISYTPGKKEAVGYLFGVYVDGKDNATRIEGSIYDANSKSIIFNSNHFSVFGVGYTVPSEKFKDISSHWAKESIDYVVGRGLFFGTSATAFSPDVAMSRGMLVTALGRLAGVDVSNYTTVSFTDVAADKYYAPYIEWAYKNGIVSGIGYSQFDPDRAITREEIALIFSNYAKATGYTLPLTREAAAFADDSGIGSTYVDAVKAMQQAGIMMGGNGNKFNPKVSATRAEVSAMLHRYIKLTIDPATAQGWAVNEAGQRMYYKNGKALTGWQTIGSGSNKKRYYFTTDAIILSGKWLEIDSKWYYFKKDGSLAVNTTIDGYKVDENGVRQSK